MNGVYDDSANVCAVKISSAVKFQAARKAFLDITCCVYAECYFMGSFHIYMHVCKFHICLKGISVLLVCRNCIISASNCLTTNIKLEMQVLDKLIIVIQTLITCVIIVIF